MTFFKIKTEFSNGLTVLWKEGLCSTGLSNKCLGVDAAPALIYVAPESITRHNYFLIILLTGLQR